MDEIDIKYDDQRDRGGREAVWKKGNDRNNQWAADANLIRHKNETYWERIRFCADQKDKNNCESGKAKKPLSLSRRSWLSAKNKELGDEPFMDDIKKAAEGANKPTDKNYFYDLGTQDSWCEWIPDDDWKVLKTLGKKYPTSSFNKLPRAVLPKIAEGRTIPGESRDDGTTRPPIPMYKGPWTGWVKGDKPLDDKEFEKEPSQCQPPGTKEYLNTECINKRAKMLTLEQSYAESLRDIYLFYDKTQTFTKNWHIDSDSWKNLKIQLENGEFASAWEGSNLKSGTELFYEMFVGETAEDIALNLAMFLIPIGRIGKYLEGAKKWNKAIQVSQKERQALRAAGPETHAALMKARRLRKRARVAGDGIKGFTAAKAGLMGAPIMKSNLLKEVKLNSEILDDINSVKKMRREANMGMSKTSKVGSRREKPPSVGREICTICNRQNCK